jgi:glucose-1-phosphate adenylyltransferase
VPRALPPARFATSAGRRGRAVDALVAAGCVVDGASVRRAVLSAGVRVGPRSRVEDAVVLPGAVVGRDVVLRGAIVDEGCVLPDGLRVGVDAELDRARFHVSEGGVVVVTAARLAALAHRGASRPVAARAEASPQPC